MSGINVQPLVFKFWLRGPSGAASICLAGLSLVRDSDLMLLQHNRLAKYCCKTMRCVSMGGRIQRAVTTACGKPSAAVFNQSILYDITVLP